MPDTSPIVIGRIPASARLPNGFQMQRGMLMLDNFADAAVGRTPDGKFTKANFEFYRSKSDAYLIKHARFGLGLKKFGSFTKFKALISRLINKNPRKPITRTAKRNPQYEKIITQLLRVARTSRNMRKRWEAVDTMGDNFFWHPKVVAFTVQLLKLTPAQARKEAMSMYGTSRVRIALLFKPSLLAEGIVRLKAEALKALGLGGGAKEVQHIAPLLKNSDKRIRRAALKALRKIYTRRRALLIKQRIKDPDPAPISTILLKDRSVSTRRDAVSVLGMMRSTRSETVRLSALIAALNDRDTSVIKLAMDALAAIGRNWTVPYIKPFLKDRRSSVRAKAAQCIGRFKHSASQIKRTNTNSGRNKLR